MAATRTPAAKHGDPGRAAGLSRRASTREDGGAALWAVWSPDSPAATESVSAHADHGGGDSGVSRPFRHAKFGEGREATTAHPAVSVDPSGERRIGGGARRRRRRHPCRGREEEGEGGLCGRFAETSPYFCGNAMSSFAVLIRGLRVLFTASGGAFFAKASPTPLLAVGSTTDGRDRSYCSYCFSQQ